MTELLKSYAFEDQLVRIVQRDDDLWFVAKDAATVLGYRDAPNMTRNLDDDEKGTHRVSTPGGDQELSIISESGLYAAIFASRKPQARRFRKWVTSEVLPAIRRTGTYALHHPEPDLPPAVGPLDTQRLFANVSAVREARRLYGPAAARNLWAELGLPTGFVPPSPDDGDFRAKVSLHVADAHEVWICDVAQAIGIENPDAATVRRIKDVLADMGFAEYKVKRRSRRGRAWQRRPSATGRGC